MAKKKINVFDSMIAGGVQGMLQNYGDEIFGEGGRQYFVDAESANPLAFGAANVAGNVGITIPTAGWLLRGLKGVDLLRKGAAIDALHARAKLG